MICKKKYKSFLKSCGGRGDDETWRPFGLIQTKKVELLRLEKYQYLFQSQFFLQSLFNPKNAFFEDRNFEISWGRGEEGVVMEHESTLVLN